MRDSSKEVFTTSHGARYMTNLEMEFEAIYHRAFFSKAKKRYASHCVWKSGQEVNELVIVGFEPRRSDNSQFSKNLMTSIFDMLLRQDKSKDEVISYISNEINRIRDGSYRLSEIGIPRGISKPLEYYGKYRADGSKRIAIPANIRGAIYARDILGLELSDKPKLLYLNGVPEGYELTDVLCFDEDNQVPAGFVVDVNKMLEKLVKDKLDSVFEALNWRLSELQWHWRGKAPKAGIQESLFALNEYSKKG